MIMELVNHIQQDFDLSLYAREVFERPTIGHLAGHLDSELKDDKDSQLTGKVSDQPPKSVIQIDYGGGTRAFEPAKEPNPSMAFLLSSPSTRLCSSVYSARF